MIAFLIGFIYGICTCLYYLAYIKEPETMVDWIIFVFNPIITPLHLIYRGVYWCLIKLGSNL